MNVSWICRSCGFTFPDVAAAGGHSRVQGHWVERVELRENNAGPEKIPAVRKAVGA